MPTASRTHGSPLGREAAASGPDAGPLMHGWYVLVAVVLVYSIVQSVFGVGLLVFGTPTLLLLGFSFEEVLAYLLPCSLAISTMQVWEGGLTFEPIRQKVVLYTAPMVLLGTVLVLVVLNHKLNIRTFVGAMLLATAAIRLADPLQERFARLVRRHLTPFLAGLGIVHGLTNLGGGILTAMVSALYPNDKRSTRKHVAFAYGVMAAIQLGTLFATTSVSWNWRLQLLLPLVAGVTYYSIGRRVFELARERAYQLVLTALIGSFGILLLLPT